MPGCISSSLKRLLSGYGLCCKPLDSYVNLGTLVYLWTDVVPCWDLLGSTFELFRNTFEWGVI